MPTSADAAVVHYHRWVEEFAGGSVFWAREGKQDTLVGRDVLTERLHSHTEHCSSCSGALSAARNMRRPLELITLLALLIAALAGQELQYPCAAACLLAAGLRVLAEETELKLTVGDYPPPRNQLPFDFARILRHMQSHMETRPHS